MSGVANAVLGGWQVSGITGLRDGFPLAAQRPNVTGDPTSGSCPNGSTVGTLNCWFNTTAFTQPAAFTFGNAPRTMPNLRGAEINNWDLAIQKWWHVQEKLRIQFRTEFFNAFNRTYLFTPDAFLGSPNFGRISEAGPQRSIQLGLKVYW